MFVYFPSQFS